MERLKTGLPSQASETEKAKGNQPKDWQAIVGEIGKLYPDPNQPVFYRRDSRLHQLASRETLNNILTLAREAGVIPLPHRISLVRYGWRVFYSQDEITRAILHREKLRQEGVEIFLAAKKLRREIRTEPCLTIKEAAQQLGMPIAVFYRLIKTGQISLDDERLNESIRRIRHPDQAQHKLINPFLLEEESFQRAVEKWRNRYKNLDNLSLGVFKAHRELYATVSQVAKAANLHVRSSEISKIAKLLIDSDLKVVKFGKNRGQSYWILSRDDEEKAVEILKRSPQVEKYRKDPVEQIAGPKIEQVPTLRQLMRDREKYLSVTPFLRALDVKIGGRSRNQVEKFLGEDCPVTVFKCELPGRRIYRFPAEQQELLAEFVRGKTLS